MLSINTVNEQIQNEYDRLIDIFSTLPIDTLDVAIPLIENASFMYVTLKRLQKEINSGSTTDEYKNGSDQFGRKCSAELQTYNSLVKNYSAIISKLIILLPDRPVRTRTKLEQSLDEIESEVYT